MTQKFILIPFLALAGCLILLINGCADDPSSLGLKFINPADTTGIRTFDSYTDPMGVSFSNVKRYVNTNASPYIIVGQKDNYSSKGLIRFYNLPSNYDSSTVLYAELRLKYGSYYFPNTVIDSSAPVAFNVVKIEQKKDLKTITLDSVNASTFGTAPQGSYSGTLDTSVVKITLNNQLVDDWLEAAADTNGSFKNYGIALDPSAGANSIKGFYSQNQAAGLSPQLYFIVQKNGSSKADTLLQTVVETAFLANVDLTPLPGRFFLQSGVSYFEVMRFFISSIPSTATINDAKLFIYLDSANSKLSRTVENRLKANHITDSSALIIEAVDFSGDKTNAASGEYMFRLILSFQRWIRGEANYGLLVSPVNNLGDLSLFTFYGPDAAETNKRPRVQIKYTPRITTDDIRKEAKDESAQ